MINARDFRVKRDDLQSTKIVEKTYSNQLLDDQVLLEIDHFSITSNNITYGVVGTKMNYWDFFPTDSDYGIIPAWGFANVLKSQHPNVKAGERFYGYYPMSSHLLVNVDKVSQMGFVDQSEHRQKLPPVYNFYSNVQTDPSFTPDTEELNSIYRPLFITSFLIEAHLVKEKFYSASYIIITSASSKTAQALASLLAHRKERNDLQFHLVGLTSPKNTKFVSDLGWYDQVISYDFIDQLKINKKAIVIDFAGNYNTQVELQSLLTENLVYNCLVGIADWKNLNGNDPKFQKGTFFFAPTYAVQFQELWGRSEFMKKVGVTWKQFSDEVYSMISINEYDGFQELEKLYLDMLNGRIDPQIGNIVKLSHKDS